jgi:hypothetical protein
MSVITEQLQGEIENLDLTPYYDERICLWEVSKDLRGEFVDTRTEDQKCQHPGCLTHKARLTFTVRVLTNHPCDSVAANGFDGEMKGELVFAYIENGHRRGDHVGKFEWYGSTSRLIGRMAGVTNAGTHRDPVGRCEPCDRRGHMEGRLEAVVIEGEHKGCRVLATYVINFDPGHQAQNTHVLGTLEGVLICPCDAPS